MGRRSRGGRGAGERVEPGDSVQHGAQGGDGGEAGDDVPGGVTGTSDGLHDTPSRGRVGISDAL